MWISARQTYEISSLIISEKYRKEKIKMLSAAVVILKHFKGLDTSSEELLHLFFFQAKYQL